MSGLIPFNRKNNSDSNTGYEDFAFMLDDFFGDGWWLNRNLLHDTFKIDVKETEHDYIIEAELPGIQKENMDLNVEEEVLFISVLQEAENSRNRKGYIHKERHGKSMSRRIKLGKAKHEKIEAILYDGILTIIVPKDNDAVDEHRITVK